MRSTSLRSKRSSPAIFRRTARPTRLDKPPPVNTLCIILIEWTDMTGIIARSKTCVLNQRHPCSLTDTATIATAVVTTAAATGPMRTGLFPPVRHQYAVAPHRYFRRAARLFRAAITTRRQAGSFATVYRRPQSIRTEAIKPPPRRNSLRRRRRFAVETRLGELHLYDGSTTERHQPARIANSTRRQNRPLGGTRFASVDDRRADDYPRR